MMAEDAVAHLAGGAQACGIAQFSQFQETFLAAFPDLSVRILRSVGDETQGCLHWEVSGTPKGDFAGIATTNRKVSFCGMSFVTVRDGKITRGGTVEP
jgi:predicted ester cyclase